jgi:HlyD family secretion protein
VVFRAAGECYTHAVTEGLPGTSAERLQIPDVQKRIRTQRLVWMAVLLAAAVVGLSFFRGRDQPIGEQFRTVRVERRDVVRVIEATGHLDARTRFEVPPPFAGRVSELRVKPGDRVRAGELLARLDGRAGGFVVQNANASKEAATWHMAEAKSAHEAASGERARVERLVARGLASNQELELAHSALARANAALEAARAQQALASGQLASAKYEQQLTDIVAPIDGVVLVAPDNLGSAVTPARTLFVIGAPLELMRVDVDVSEADIGEVRVAQRTSFEVQSYPGRKFGARVLRVGVEPRREGAVITYPVQLMADNPDGALLPGMSASVQLEVARSPGVLAVREAALRYAPPGFAPAPARTRLFRRVGPDQLIAVPVVPGLSDGTYTQVQGTGTGSLALSERDEIAVGLLRPDSTGRAQPGISLGRK